MSKKKHKCKLGFTSCGWAIGKQLFWWYEYVKCVVCGRFMSKK